MSSKNLMEFGRYSLDWAREFYDASGDWWGANTDIEYHASRAGTVERLCGHAGSRLLDLGCGPGGNSAAMADLGYNVTALDLSPKRLEYARQLAAAPRKGSMSVVEGDFYTVVLPGKFDVITCWEVFGLGSDADQRRLLRRMVNNWLAPGGSVLMDVYLPYLQVRSAGKSWRLDPLEGVPGSMEMIERCHFDPLHSRWIDEWQPVQHPEQTLSQTIRCYSPADFLLLIEGAGLKLAYAELNEKPLDFSTDAITISEEMMTAWYFLAQLKAE